MQGREYRITVEGEISDPLGAAFPGMTLSRRDGKSELTGWVRDQAELQGLLRRVSDFGMTLLGVTAIGGDDEEGGHHDQPPSGSSGTADRRDPSTADTGTLDPGSA